MSQQDTLDDSFEHTFRILIATDNHIGYLERDPVRGKDSFNTFEEILKIAKREQVDFILLGGDLFHHNRPSRMCMYETMRMIRRHCFGGRESKIWIASDQSVNFAEEFCNANYLDENLNISIPIFSIHGNHDDPSGTGNLCALNLLSVAGMVNYFGTSPSIDDVTVNPILMQKGESKLALFGLGNIGEERLHRKWRSGKVKFMRPQDDGTSDSWRDCFNMFVFHQNRARHGPSNHIPVEFLDSFLDLVMWGHEHECRIQPEQYQDFAVTQPGSSVATSLSENEAEAKHVAILSIEGRCYSLEKIRLKTVRPFQFTTVSLSQVPTLRPSEPKGVQVYLEGVVESLIERAKLEWEEQQRADSYHDEVGEPNTEIPMPLIRIRVDYSGGYDTFNSQQFGKRFIDRVANPNDILKFYRVRTEPRTVMQKPSEMLQDLSIALPERLDKFKVEDLVNEMLSNDLVILPEAGLEEAVMSLVDKNDKESIRNFITKSVARTRDDMTVLPEDLSLDYIKRKSSEFKESHDQPRRRVNEQVPPTQEMQGNTTSNANNNNNNSINLEDNDDEDDILSNMTPPPRRSTERTARSTPASRRRVAVEISDGEDDEVISHTNTRRNTQQQESQVISSDSEEDDYVEEPKPKPTRKRAATSTAESSQASTGKKRRVLPGASNNKKKR